ncbi:MAG: hypothetical protein A2Y12_10635 [Planctomycetes bacterium GWF2_42_9]|nr:MAG: hypothetical protein A2Y12_10635 [Planctomycetes bacterium GWF2_42_9]
MESTAPKTRKITIADVAKKASVSPGTVSRVLSGTNTLVRISEKTRKTVIEAARQLNFYPNYAAQSLASAKTHTIGVAICQDQTGRGFIGMYEAMIISGIEEAAHEQGYDILLMSLVDPVRDIERCKRIFLQNRIDGLVMITSPERDIIVKELVEMGETVVAIDAYGADIGIPCVNIDNIKAIKIAMQYLTSLGHRKIGFIGTLKDQEGIEESLRRKGYEAGLKFANIALDPAYIINGSSVSNRTKGPTGGTFDDGYIGVKELMSRVNGLTAVVCHNDLVAAGVIAGLNQAGKKIPSDVSVIGFDDSIVSRTTFPSLCSIRHPTELMGKVAVDLILKTGQDNSKLNINRRYVLDAELVIRDSVSPIA